MKRLLVVVVAATCLAACNRDRAMLETEVQRLRGEREKLTKIAEHLDEFKLEIARLEEDLGRVERRAVPLSHDERIKKATALAGITAKRVAPYGGPVSSVPWELSGSGDALFDTLSLELASLAVERLTVTTTGWTVSVPAWDTLSSYSTIPAATGIATVATPSSGSYETRRTRALRAEIDALEKECAELTRLVGDVKQFEQKKEQLEQSLGLLNAPTRLGKVARVAGPVFFEPKSPCTQGSITVAQQSARLFCTPPASDLEASSTALRETLGAVEGWKVGTISIDEAAPEPLQGTLTPHPQ